MKSLESHLVQYALYHRDNRNIRTHLIGVPLIVWSVILLTFIPLFELSGIQITLSSLLTTAVSFYYLYLSPRLGVVMIGMLALGNLLAMQLYTQFIQSGVPVTIFYFGGLGVFLIGWVVQFIGHYYEGKKPAFVDDLIGLLIGPLFVLVEVLFKLGLMKGLEENIISQAGPYRN
ncbi:DUF962 domain-containing protein [Pseudoalteromonas luteoviolacea]|uniref:DUF962 domain-containing protein n=1 Tax=Pseudoalteromonas luteoviolacea S4054 TaxID=1129367 RepID=A0A0F6ABW5_9GAMM|nr:Mpo1-like protein [Pseudoalteromonas luteoviolacea]AOT09013.1 hypothetical protein S4054249_14585 [Pseudoalteromonas luteoviolacea]AOT13925.1 hypothetical protein S40542_14555 [Pseudoalteromonas luteoviolacea]AOT18840.1 hypothetical protein S4054_14560 [Pseudoalteromonas luteoviolacea]KKE83648.1 hypothetical protein N479_01060 [Pseudoalteromonas luteoviolacea S4054]KZN63413.1 hypothetical protein N481_25615 [Pseudoalteromonas luteoviolacea S4047-1]